MVNYKPLLSIARNYLDAESAGARPQIKLLEHLMGEDPIVLDPKAPNFSTSRTIAGESSANILATPIVARTLDPSLFEGANERFNASTPPEFFGKYCDGLRRLNDQHQDNIRRGRSYALRNIAGMPSYFGQDPINDEDAAKISDALNSKGYKAGDMEFTPKILTDFVKGYNGIIPGLENPILDHWTGKGRRERVKTHAGKLILMNCIMAATLEMAREAGVDLFETPNGNGTPLYQDEYISDSWKKAGEYPQSPSALLEESRRTIARAKNYLMFSGIATAAERAVYNLRRNGK
ncbi:MAG: hypothetical protein HYT71_02565 [Candidatus Aenigmarchaeota archaeon]|nr:hypothetical protein [Candidatus Aenigmarchaeota archaeon]